MDSKIDSLELAVRQSLQGLFPRKPHTINYTQAKARIKKELKLILSVKEIDQIIHLIILSIWNAQYQVPLLELISQTQIKAFIKDNEELFEQFQYEINQNMVKNQTYKALEIIVEEMDQFKDPDKFQKDITRWRSKVVWDTKTYESKKLQLNVLFNKELSKEEFYLIADIWCYYMVFAEDLLGSDKFTQEKIKELKKTLAACITHHKGLIKANEKLIKQLQDIAHFTFTDIEAQKENLLRNERQLDELKFLEERLRQDNSHELNINNIQEKAYFSVFFLGELLGLSEPEHNKDGNPLLTFLDILTGWTKSTMPKDL